MRAKKCPAAFYSRNFWRLANIFHQQRVLAKTSFTASEHSRQKDEQKEECILKRYYVLVISILQVMRGANFKASQKIISKLVHIFQQSFL